MREILEYGLVFRFDFNIVLVITGYLVTIAAGYFLGSLNAGIIISRLVYKDDIRNHGSGGAGTSDMLHTYGKFPAAVTLICDGLKALAAIFIGMIFFGNSFASTAVYAGAYVGGLAAAAGHAFPVYYKFKGGKSVAAAFATVLATSPVIALLSLVIFGAIVWGTKYVSLGLIMSSMIYPLILNRLTGMGMHNIIAIILMLLVVLLHRDNIKRLGAGTENKINIGRKKIAEAKAKVERKEKGEK